MLEMAIDSIRVSLMNYQRVVILKEKASNRYLPIWIGPSEADAIAVRLQDVSVPRPLTHDLLREVISNLGASTSHIVISDLTNDTFFAKIVLDADGRTLEVDSRPSDAIALAVRSNAPIFVEERVMDKAGILLDRDTGKPISVENIGVSGAAVSESGGRVQEEELAKLSAFSEFINSLDLEDFEKRGNM